jgi:hypothetical protein
MPRNLIGKPPFPPAVLFDEDRNFAVDDLLEIVRKRPRGVSICVRYPEGPPKRGGYFFHFAPRAEGIDEFQVYDFEKTLVKTFSATGLTALINHCTGRKFDEDSFLLCQTELNFLKDKEPSV